MPRDYRLQIDDIRASIEKIREYVRGMGYEQFCADSKTQDAVIRNLEIIGEAARALPDDLTSAATAVDWRKIVGLRNLLIREYFGISPPIIWDVVSNKLGDLEIACGQVMEELE